jgi:chromosome partitioning protein
MACIAVFNQKGGVAKTTSTFNLATALARAGWKSWAVDMDAQAHLTLALTGGKPPADPAATLCAFFHQKKPLREIVKETPLGVRIVPSHAELAKVESLFGGNSQAALALKRGLTEVEPEGPVLIDCCPALGVLSLNALYAADRILIPVSSDYLSLQSVVRLDAAIVALEKAMKRPLEKRIVITRFDARRKLAQQIAQTLHDRYGEQVCKTRIRECVALAESPALGKDIFAHQRKGVGAQDYGALAYELLKSGFFR